MAVEFLTDEQASRYGAFYGAPAQAELERFFFLDDADRARVQAKRRAHNRLGLAVQLTTVRFLGRFMPDPRQVAEYLAEQLGIEDAAVLAEYGERDGTARSHAGVSGPQMKAALERAQEIAALGMGEVDVSWVPPRRLAELSRYGVDGKASLLRRHADARRLATLLATAVHLTTRAVDDALDQLDVLVATRLLARAERDTAKEKLKTLPKVERAGAKLAAALQVVLEETAEQVDTSTGEITAPKVATLAAMWEAIEAVVPRKELAAAVAAMVELAPPLDSDADEAWRRMLVSRFSTVRPFLKLLVEVVDFD